MLENGTILPSGNSDNINQIIMKQWLQEIYEISEWEHIYESETDVCPHTLLRNLWWALFLYMDSFINNKMCQGYSIYRPSEGYDERFIETCDEASFAERYHISVGERFYLWDEKLILSLTGDGASNVKNTPNDVYTMCLAYLKVFAFEYDLLQCRHAGIPVLISSLPDKDDRVANYMQKLSNQLQYEGTLNVWCKEMKCWFLFDYRKYSTGDWAWQHKMSQLAVSAAGNYALINACKYEDGTPYTVHKDEYIDCLVGVRIQPYEIDKLTQAINNFQDFFTLTTNDIASYWSDLVETDVWKKLDRLPGPWTEEYEKKLRLKIATKQRHGILKRGVGNQWDFDGGVFDICHCNWSISLSLLVLLVMLMWCVWKWTDIEIVYVLSFLGAPTIVFQAVKYLTELNPNRNPKIWPKFHTTGLTNKIMFNGFPYSLVIAADIAWRYEITRNDNNNTVTYILAVFWRVTTLMKRAFGILFKSRFDKPAKKKNKNKNKNENEINDNNNNNNNDNNDTDIEIENENKNENENDNNDTDIEIEIEIENENKNDNENENDEEYIRPPLIQEMIDCVSLATFIAYNLCDVMVCVLVVFYSWF